MKIIKTTILGLLIAGLVNPITTQAEDNWLTIYGKLNISLDKVDEDNGDDIWELSNHASRVGLKGKGAAGDNFEAFYKFEWEVDVTDNGKTSDDHIKSRNQYVGLRGGFGEVLLGRHDTPTKSLQKKTDVFSDFIGDIKYSLNGEKRADNIVIYTTPKMSGFKVKAAFVPGEENEGNDGLADGTSVAIEYGAGDLSLGLSFDSDIEKDNLDTTRFITQYKYDAWQFGLIYQTSDYDGADGDGVMVSGKYKSGDNVFKLQLINSDLWETEISSKVKYATQTSLGWDHKMGKKVTGYTYFTLGEEGETGDNDSTLGVGIVLKF
ncbi:MAG: porin [Gammaproteobacteria bacterium]|nr:porin [Gammaproteobacteria bacterium]